MSAVARRGVVLVLAVQALPGLAHAWGYGVQANVITEVTNFPASDRKDGNLLLDFDPRAASLQAVDRQAALGTGMVAVGQFLGSSGLLKAYASARYPLGGGGMASSTVTSSFYDTIAVSGAGLAVGTPVSYRVDFSIEGTADRAPAGSNYGAFADAVVSLYDDSTRQEVHLNWSDQQKPGLYSLTLNTTVGHSLVMSGSLNVGARVQGNSLTGRFAEADFYHSARYALAPSVAGLNTLGQSGHNFAVVSSVPEPSTWVLMALGVAGIAWRRQAAPRRR